MAGLSEKRGRGRPVGSTKKDSLLKKLHDMPEKRGRGRPRLVRLQALDIPKTKAGHKEASRKEGLMRPRELAAKDVVMPEKRVNPRPSLKRERAVNIPDTSVGYEGPIHNTNIKEKYIDENGRSIKKSLLVKEKLKASLEVLVGTKRGRGRPRKTLSEQIAGTKAQYKMNPLGVASVTVVVEKRGRGRPRKVPPEKDEVSVFSHNIWNNPVHYEQCQKMGRFHSHTDFINSEMAVSSTETDPLQISHEVSSPGMDLQGGWVGEVMNKEGDNEHRTECQHPYWEAKPLAPEWTPETVEYPENSLDNSMPHWVVENTTVPQSQYLGEQLNHQEDLLKELSDFKCQLLSELAATRAEIREGAQLMKSAISGVSAEIHRLGQILQPLVSVITAGSVSRQGHPMTFVPRPPQDTPPDDTMNFTESPGLNKTSFSHQDTISAHPHKLPTDGLTEEDYSVKMEDAMDSPQPCTHQAQSAVSTQVDSPTAPTTLLHHQLNLCQSKSTPLASPNSPMNIPHPNMSTFEGLQGDISPGSSSGNTFLEAPNIRSSKPSPPERSVDCVSNSSECRPISSASSSKESSLPASSVVGSPVDHCPYRPVKLPTPYSSLGEAR